MSPHRFPYPDTFVIINGYRMHYFQSGTEEDRAVVMVHGNYSSAYAYRNFFPYCMAAGWRCLAPDCIGFGGSDKPRSVDIHTFDFHSDNLEIFVRELGLRNIVLVGHEWGGLMALDYAINRSDNTMGLVMMNSDIFLSNHNLGLRGFLHRFFLEDLLVRGLNLPLRDSSLQEKVYCKGNMDTQVKAQYQDPYPSYESRAGLLAFLRMGPRAGNEYFALRMKAMRSSLPRLSAH